MSGSPAPPEPSRKTTFFIKGALFLQHEITGTSQLVRQRFGCHVGLGLLAFVKALGSCVVTQRKVRRFDKRPRQISVTVLAVAFAFLLSIGVTATEGLGVRSCLLPRLSGTKLMY
jgi:hypothetical protein